MLKTMNLTKQFGSRPLFENISVQFEDNARYGLIGANGAGKSTFMKILTGEIEATHGSVSLSPNETMATLKQDQFAYEDYTVINAVMVGHQELWEVGQERERLYSLPDMTEAEGIKVAELEIRFAELDGYTAESRAGELLLGVDIPLSLHQKKMSEIAPGLKLRVLLTQVLFSNPNIMLFDEPTNNLDINTIRWLEGELRSRNCCMIIISHDRHFLNAVCTHTADLDYGELRLFPGAYDEYMIAATQAREKLHSDNAKKKEKIAELQTFVSRFSANASKARQATSRLKQIDKLTLEEVKPSSRRNPYIKFTQKKKLHKFAVTLEHISNGYGASNPLFKDVDLAIEVGQRVAILGASGVGKSCFLKSLIGQLPLQSGEVKWTDNAQIGYLAQDHGDEFKQDMTLYDWMDQWSGPADDEQAIRGILGRMLFSGNDINKKVSITSGGEKVRLLLGKLILQQPNILVLDEPTNHLDMESIESLNDAMAAFDGTIIFASQDRALVSSVATQIIELHHDGKAIHYQGDYEHYLTSQ